MKTKLIGSDLAYAKTLHKKSLIQAKKAAIAAGWSKDFVEEVDNLEYGLKAINLEIKTSGATKSQAQAIVAVYEASKLLIATDFALAETQSI